MKFQKKKLWLEKKLNDLSTFHVHKETFDKNFKEVKNAPQLGHHNLLNFCPIFKQNTTIKITLNFYNILLLQDFSEIKKCLWNFNISLALTEKELTTAFLSAGVFPHRKFESDHSDSDAVELAVQSGAVQITDCSIRGTLLLNEYALPLFDFRSWLGNVT